MKDIFEYVKLSKEDLEFVQDYLSLPEKEQRFTELLIRIGATTIMNEEEYLFFVQYLREQGVTLMKNLAPKTNDIIE